MVSERMGLVRVWLDVLLPTAELGFGWLERMMMAKGGINPYFRAKLTLQHSDATLQDDFYFDILELL